MDPKKALIDLVTKAGGEIDPDKVFVLTSRSMFPVLRPGDVLAFEETAPDKVSTGEIVAYTKGENLLVHRVIGKCNSTFPFRVKGDNCFCEDNTDQNCKFVGKLRWAMRENTLIDFQHPFRRTISPFTALISRANLFPELIRRKLGSVIFDPLRESTPVNRTVSKFYETKLTPKNFLSDKGRGECCLALGNSNIGTIFYKINDNTAVVECFWLKFPFSYKHFLPRLLSAAEKEWKKAGIKKVEIKFLPERKKMISALVSAGYTKNTEGFYKIIDPSQPPT